MRNIALLTFLVCSTAWTATAAAKPAPKPAVVSLKVTVNANQQYSTPTGIPTSVTSDTVGQYPYQYIDGQNNVSANLDSNGNLVINLSSAGGKKGNSTSRQLGLYLGAAIAPPTDGTYSCTPPSTISPSNPPAYTNAISTWPVADAGRPAAPAFQDMVVGQTYYVGLEIATMFSDSGQTIYFLIYHRTDCDCFPADAALTSYPQVRRTSQSPGHWVVEPVVPSGLSGAPPNVAMLIQNAVTSTAHQSIRVKTECGFYQVPFSFTLDEQ